MITRTSARFIAVLCVLLACLLALGWAGAAASGDYAIGTSDSTETPTQTVEIEGSEYTISSIATAEPDGSFTASVTVPEDTRYSLDVLNADEQPVIDTIYGSGSGQETVDVDGVEPGTYALVLWVDRDVVAVKPLVIESYDVSLEAPAEHAEGESLTVSVEATPTAASGAPAGVEVAVWNGEEVIRTSAESAGDDTYEATVSGLAEGDYQVYAAAQGTDEVLGEPEALGVSSGHWVSVTDDDGDGSDDGEDTGGDDGSDDGGAGSDDGNGQGDDDPAGSDDSGDGDDTSGLSDGSDAGDDGVLSPSEPDDASDDAMAVIGPGSIVAVIGLLVAVLVRSRRSSASRP